MVEFNYIIGISASEYIPEDIKFTYLNRSVNGFRTDYNDFTISDRYYKITLENGRILKLSVILDVHWKGNSIK